VINVAGGVLKRVDGILQVTGLPATAVTKVSSGNVVAGQKATTAAILANPDNYESTLVTVVKSGFNPLPAPTDTYAGDRTINDGFGNMTLHTEATATFAKSLLPANSNFTGILFKSPAGVPQLRLRTGDDVKFLSPFELSPMVFTGYLTDPNSTDGNYEYFQLLATRDIDFSVEKFTLVTTNNAAASTPQGAPTKGWATGGLRTYKIEITSGKVTKGSYFYIGGTGKNINGAGSTDISSSNWVKNVNYVSNDSPVFNPTDKTFGTKTGGLMANSGNASGFAIFAGTNITLTTKPVDVIFITTGGTLYDAGANVGYTVANTDFYDLKNVITLADQPYYRQGTNTLAFSYPAANNWALFGGEYNTTLGRWTVARALVNIPLVPTSTLKEIENDQSTKLVQ
jgi:hypothetical protein